MNPLPEIVGKLNRQQQLELLRTKLAGHQSFGFLRGNFDDDPCELIGDSPKPTAVLNKWDERSKHIRVMLDLLAKLKRDKYQDAYEELLAALCGTHIIEGETVPLEQTTPVVAMMFDLDIVLPLVGWALTHTYEEYQHFVLNRRDLKSRDPILGKMYLDLPDMEKVMEAAEKSNFRTNPYYNFLLHSYSSLREKWADILREKIHINSQIFLRLNSCNQPMIMAGQYPFGFLFNDETQKNVLSVIPREKQAKVSTWRFDIPTSLVYRMTGGENSKFSLCLHPEEEHAHWSEMFPTFVSKGFQHGHGAILLPRISRSPTRAEELAIERGYLFPGRGRLPRDGKLRFCFDLYGENDDR